MVLQPVIKIIICKLIHRYVISETVINANKNDYVITLPWIMNQPYQIIYYVMFFCYTAIIA